MRVTAPVIRFFVCRGVAAFAIALLLAGTRGAAQQPIMAGPNVNIIGGPAKIVKTPDGKYQLLEGDPGQRQNEVSCFVDSRDPLDIGCAYNDYTPVEIAGLNGDGETGDAWVGQSVSTDGGFTWRKFMFPGYKQDGSPEGLASPLHGLDAAADPTWVSGPGGVSYLSAIAFNRGAVPTGGTQGAQTDSVAFVQKYINNNNVENDLNPFKPSGKPVFFPANSGNRFQDKPWAGVAPNGDFHLVWAAFASGSNKPHSTIYRAVCPGGNLTNCTQTKLSEGDFVLNGTILTFHPTTGWTDIAYRRRKSGQTSDTDAIIFVRCFTNSSCSKPMVVVAPADLKRSDNSVLGALFDQGSGSGIFRNVSNPAIAADSARRVYVAWAQRIQSYDSSKSLVTRDSRIMLSVGNSDTNGNITSWSAPVAVDSLTANPPVGRGHEIRPQMWFGSGKVYLAATILHQDQTQGKFDLKTSDDPGKPGGKILKYVETREPKGELDPAKGTPPSAKQVGRTFTEFVYDRAPEQPTLDVAPKFNQRIDRRHTEEIGLWTGTPASTAPPPPFSLSPPAPGLPTFTFTNVWRSRIGLLPSGRYEQIEFNAGGIDMFNSGGIAFHGDYDSVITRAWVPRSDGTGYVPNTSPSDTSPVYVAWTDNRNVRTYVPTQFFTPAGTPLCDPNAPHAALTRNQDIYMARAGLGLYVYAVGNQKQLGTATFDGLGTFQIKRAFLIQFQNPMNATKHYRAVIANQPIGGTASWKQFAQLTQIDLTLPPFSSQRARCMRRQPMRTPPFESTYSKSMRLAGIR